MCLYLRNTIEYKNRSDLISSEIEALCIEITKPHSKPYAVLACYRSTDSEVDHFFDEYEAIVAKLDSEGKEFYVLGDLNCNLLSHVNNCATHLLMCLSIEIMHHVFLLLH